MRYLVFLSMFAICTQSFAADKIETGRTLTTAIGHQLEFTPPVLGTVYVKDPTTGKKELKTFDKSIEKPYRLNGKEISADVINNPVLTEMQQKIGNLVSEGLKEAIEDLHGGAYKYRVSNVVVDERGYVVYYYTEGIKDAEEFWTGEEEFHPISAAQQQTVNKAIVKILSTLKTDPFVVNGKAVPFTVNVGSRFLK